MSKAREATLETILQQIDKLHSCMEKRFDKNDTDILQVMEKQDKLDGAASADRQNAQTQFRGVHQSLGEIKSRLEKIEDKIKIDPK